MALPMTMSSALGGQVLGPVAFAQSAMPFLLKERAHRRIDVRVGAGDDETLVAQGGGHRAHGRAANAQEVEVFEVGEHERPCF